MRDNNIALKTNNYKKIDQTLVRIPHTVFKNQAVESNTKILPSVSNNKKSQHTLPVVIIPPSTPRVYTVPVLSSPQNRRLQSSDRSRPNIFLPIKKTNKQIPEPSTYPTYHEKTI